jgi:hypothetical protein
VPIDLTNICKDIIATRSTDENGSSSRPGVGSVQR